MWLTGFWQVRSPVAARALTFRCRPPPPEFSSTWHPSLLGQKCATLSTMASSLIHHKVKPQRITLPARVRFARDFTERAAVVGGEPGVARGFDIHFGEIQAVGKRDRLGVEVGAADEEDFVSIRAQRECGGDGVGDEAAVSAI